MIKSVVERLNRSDLQDATGLWGDPALAAYIEKKAAEGIQLVSLQQNGGEFLFVFSRWDEPKLAAPEAEQAAPPAQPSGPGVTVDEVPREPPKTAKPPKT